MALGWPQGIVAVVAAARLAELAYAGRNTRRLMAAGGREVGARHYPLLVLLHAAWLAALFVLTPPGAPVSWPLIAVFVALAAARLAVIGTLGRFWTTRIITLPSAPLVSGGPFRFVRHPNYLIVAIEIIVLPLALGRVALAVLFGAANGLLLAYRIRVEARALADRRTASR